MNILNCDAFNEKRCESCSLIKSEYKIGLKGKIDDLKLLFPNEVFRAGIETKNLLGYRNKAKFLISGTLDSPILGIPSIGNKQEITELLDCRIHHPKLNELANYIKQQIPKFKLSPYSIALKKGEFKYLILSLARKSGEISIRFGMRSLESFERVKKLSVGLQNQYPDIKVISFEVQAKHAAILEGESYFITEQKFIKHDFDDFTLKSSTTGFFQVNSEVAKALYDEVYRRYKDESIKTSVDLFCGVGGFAISMSRFSKKVIGVEINENAIECAKSLNAKGVEFFCDDAFKFPDYYSGGIDLLLVNPPRRGIGKEFSELICRIKPKFLVYSSCNPKTLKKDAETFGKDYLLESIIPIDMFALTSHFEVLSFWKRK